MNKVVVELMDPPAGFQGDWYPCLPHHVNGDPHIDAGMDFYAATRVVAGKDNREGLHYYEVVVPTGVRIKLPAGFHMRIASRSGLAFNNNIEAFPGTIDNSYRGQIIIKLRQITTNDDPLVIETGTRIAQGILFRNPSYTIEEGTVDTNTIRGEKGFGSTEQRGNNG